MNSIESNFVPYQIALDMKSIGFDEPCFGFYYNFGKKFKITTKIKNSNVSAKLSETTSTEFITAPTFSQAFHFFRNKYGLMHIINPYDFTAEINYLNKRVVNNVYGDFIPHDHLVDDKGEEIKHLSYEEAENACLLELIKICCKLK